MTSKATPITIAYGDGIGPEIMESAVRILKEARANVELHTIEVGKNIYEKGFNSGLMPSAWQELDSTKILLKAPITTPQGGGYKSLNVTMRKKLGLYANVRPVKAFAPYVETRFADMDVVVVRENEEDLYTGIEYRQSQETFQCLKIVTKKGCERIVRYAFEYAVKNNRKKVSCFSKDNIMKMTDGLFHKTFNEIAKEYPQIENDHHIIDIATAKLADNPEMFDVIVTMNLYGDIISDVAAEISGSVGLAGSANIGDDFAMFEAIHGSAPDIAGQNLANPTGLINATIMMLVHIGQFECANLIKNALHKTIEDGIHTGDIYSEKMSSKKVGTKEFTEELIKRLGQKPEKLEVSNFKEIAKQEKSDHNQESQIDERKSIGFDLYIDWQKELPDLKKTLSSMESEVFEVKTISAKGLLLWPQIDEHNAPNYIKGQTVLRFIKKGVTGKTSVEITNPSIPTNHDEIIGMLKTCSENQIDFVKYEGLYTFNGKAGYTPAQGE